VAFDQSGPRWLGISDLIAEPEGPTFISYEVARSRLDRLRFVTQDPDRTLTPPRNVAIWHVRDASDPSRHSARQNNNEIFRRRERWLARNLS